MKKSSAVPAFRKAYEWRNPSPQPTNRFDTSVQAVCWSTRGSAFPAGVRDPDVVNQVPLRNTSQANDTSLHYKKRWSISSTSASQITSTSPTALAVPSCSTRTPFTRTSKSSPLTSTTGPTPLWGPGDVPGEWSDVWVLPGWSLQPNRYRWEVARA